MLRSMTFKILVKEFDFEREMMEIIAIERIWKEYGKNSYRSFFVARNRLLVGILGEKTML